MDFNDFNINKYKLYFPHSNILDNINLKENSFNCYKTIFNNNININKILDNPESYNLNINTYYSLLIFTGKIYNIISSFKPKPKSIIDNGKEINKNILLENLIDDINNSKSVYIENNPLDIEKNKIKNLIINSKNLESKMKLENDLSKLQDRYKFQFNNKKIKIVKWLNSLSKYPSCTYICFINNVFIPKLNIKCKPSWISGLVNRLKMDNKNIDMILYFNNNKVSLFFPDGTETYIKSYLDSDWNLDKYLNGMNVIYKNTNILACIGENNKNLNLYELSYKLNNINIPLNLLSYNNKFRYYCRDVLNIIDDYYGDINNIIIINLDKFHRRIGIFNRKKNNLGCTTQ